jgi:hypothetical protein
MAPAWVDPFTLTELTDDWPSTPGASGSPRPQLPAGQIPFPSGQPSIGSGPAVVVVHDTFERDITDSWGSADVGGRYSLRGLAADLDVGAGVGTMRLPTAGFARSAFLSDVSIRDSSLKFSVRIDELPVGGRVYVYALVRRTASGTGYRPQVHITPGGAVYAHAGLLLDDGEHSLGRPVLVPDLVSPAGKDIWVRAEATGSDPTTIRVRAWADGNAEPNYWHFAVIDWTGNLQGTGAVGMAGYLGSRTTNGGALLHFDDLLITTTDAPTSTNGAEPANDN